MAKSFFILLFVVFAAYGQQTSVAVLPSDGTVLNNDELEALTDKMREAALKVLPTNTFVLLKQDVVVKRLGGAENYIKKCKESSCIVDLGKQAQVDYVAQASVGKLGDKIRLKVELYNVRTEGLVGMLSDEESENVKDLLAIVEKRVPEVFNKIKNYLINITSDPKGADLSFDIESHSGCTTPCNVELPAGSVRITANLNQYETTDTTVSIKQNNQSIHIRMKPNFEEYATATNFEKPIKTSFWVAIGLDVLGVALISYAVYENAEMEKAYKKYSRSWGSTEYYEDAWKDAEKSRKTRNMLYVIGGTVLASGIGVHIWF